jgi:hypothetical protein
MRTYRHQLDLATFRRFDSPLFWPTLSRAEGDPAKLNLEERKSSLELDQSATGFAFQRILSKAASPDSRRATTATERASRRSTRASLSAAPAPSLEPSAAWSPPPGIWSAPGFTRSPSFWAMCSRQIPSQSPPIATAVLILKRLRQVPVIQRGKRLDASSLQLIHLPIVKIEALRVRRARAFGNIRGQR